MSSYRFQIKPFLPLTLSGGLRAWVRNLSILVAGIFVAMLISQPLSAQQKHERHGRPERYRD